MKFIKESLDARKGIPHSIRQKSDHIFDDVVALYRSNTKDILQEFPFRIRYIDGRASDIGGVAHDNIMFSAFWEVAYIRGFDGGNVLAPAIHDNLSCIGYYHISWLYFLPIRLSIVSCLKGPGVEIPDSFILESFMDHVSILEGSRLHNTL